MIKSDLSKKDMLTKWVFYTIYSMVTSSTIIHSLENVDLTVYATLSFLMKQGSSINFSLVFCTNIVENIIKDPQYCQISLFDLSA